MHESKQELIGNLKPRSLQEVDFEATVTCETISLSSEESVRLVGCHEDSNSVSLTCQKETSDSRNIMPRSLSYLKKAKEKIITDKLARNTIDAKRVAFDTSLNHLEDVIKIANCSLKIKSPCKMGQIEPKISIISSRDRTNEDNPLHQSMSDITLDNVHCPDGQDDNLDCEIKSQNSDMDLQDFISDLELEQISQADILSIREGTNIAYTEVNDNDKGILSLITNNYDTDCTTHRRGNSDEKKTGDENCQLIEYNCDTRRPNVSPNGIFFSNKSWYWEHHSFEDRTPCPHESIDKKLMHPDMKGKTSSNNRQLNKNDNGEIWNEDARNNSPHSLLISDKFRCFQKQGNPHSSGDIDQKLVNANIKDSVHHNMFPIPQSWHSCSKRSYSVVSSRPSTRVSDDFPHVGSALGYSHFVHFDTDTISKLASDFTQPFNCSFANLIMKNDSHESQSFVSFTLNNHGCESTKVRDVASSHLVLKSSPDVKSSFNNAAICNKDLSSAFQTSQVIRTTSSTMRIQLSQHVSSKTPLTLEDKIIYSKQKTGVLKRIKRLLCPFNKTGKANKRVISQDYTKFQ